MKHLVYAADNAIKVSCLEELGQGWLLRLIGGGGGGEAGLEPTSRALDAGDDARMHDDHTNGSSDDQTGRREPSALYGWDDDHMEVTEDGVPGLASNRHDGVNSGSSEEVARNGKSNGSGGGTAGVYEIHPETDPSIRACHDDVSVQEQGLDLIRNIISGAKSEEMIDFLFRSMGEERIFGTLASKLRLGDHHARTCYTNSTTVATTTINSTNSTNNTDTNNDKNHDQNTMTITQITHPKIVIAALYILVHIAASQPRHQQILIQQTSLLKSLVPFFSHENKDVRLALALIVINFTCGEDPSDQLACRARALELKQLGFLVGLEIIVRDDELDVREKARAGLSKLRELLAGH